MTSIKSLFVVKEILAERVLLFQFVTFHVGAVTHTFVGRCLAT